jgi:hypothetical protein
MVNNICSKNSLASHVFRVILEDEKAFKNFFNEKENFNRYTRLLSNQLGTC